MAVKEESVERGRVYQRGKCVTLGDTAKQNYGGKKDACNMKNYR